MHLVERIKLHIASKHVEITGVNARKRNMLGFPFGIYSSENIPG